MDIEIRKKLEGMSERGYADFSVKLIPGAKNVLGIRMPVLRALAKELSKEGYDLQSDGSADIYYEETLLRGMLIGTLRLSYEKRIELIKDFVPRIDNWGVCDSFCCSLKFVKKNRAAVWEFLQPYIYSEKEFEQRFAAVMLLDHFVCEEYIDRTLKALTEISAESYYASMAAAWAAAECYIKFPEKSEPYLSLEFFDKDTLGRTVKKLCESYRISDETKTKLKNMIN